MLQVWGGTVVSTCVFDLPCFAWGGTRPQLRLAWSQLQNHLALGIFLLREPHSSLQVSLQTTHLQVLLCLLQSGIPLLWFHSLIAHLLV